jgi:hypothetical protein
VTRSTARRVVVASLAVLAAGVALLACEDDTTPTPVVREGGVEAGERVEAGGNDVDRGAERGAADGAADGESDADADAP